MTELEAELLRAAERAEIRAQETDERTAGVRWKYLRGIHEAEAARHRQRAAWVRETLERINRAELTTHPQNRAVKAWLDDLTGSIPSPAPCAGCLPADGDYGDGPPPMVLGRHVEGCNGTATTERKET